MHMSRIKATGKKCSAMMVAAALMLSTVTPANAEEMTETAAVETTAEETAAKLPEQTEAAVVEVPAEQPAAAEVPAEQTTAVEAAAEQPTAEVPAVSENYEAVPDPVSEEAVPAEPVSVPETESAVSETEAEQPGETFADDVSGENAAEVAEASEKAVGETTETAAETEQVSESAAERETEQVSESAAERETEPASEFVSERETEPTSEIVSERETEPTSEIVSEHETEPASEIETETESDLEDDAKIKEAESGEEKEKYLVSYLNEDGVVETSRTCKAGEDVDLSVHLGGGEKQLGWSLSEGGEVLGSLKMPENDLELYPVLDKTEASYEINFWQENLSGGYEKVSSRSVTAKAGDMVSAAEVQASKYAKQFAGFTYDGAASSASETVAADGSTVVDVRFKRNTYTISFDLNGNYRSVSDLYYASLSMNVGGATYTGSSYSFTARYGEDISDRWPTAENIVNNPYLSRRYSDYFGGWNGPDGVTRTGAGALNDSLVGGSGDGGTITFSANWVNAGSSAEIPNATIQYHIYQQNVENDDYTLVDTISKTAPASQLTKIALDGYAGYEYDHNTPVGNKTTLKYGPWYAETKVEYYPEQNLYFNRNSYQLTFQIDDETVRSESVKYQAPLAEYSSYEPEDKPAGRAWLDGWYDAEGTLYTFDSMPAEDVVLTASWKYDQLQSLSLTYDLNGADGSIAGKKTAKEVDLRLADASEYAMTGYHFAGWNTKADGSGETYAGRSMFKLAEDTTLYAVWKVNSYTVTWVNEDGTVLETDFEVPYGEMPSYDSAAPVKDGDADMVYTFRGWQPGLTSVTEDVTYTAVFDAVPAETEEPVTEAPKEEPVTEVPTEEPMTEVPMEEPVTEAPTEEPVTEAPTEEPVTEAPTEEPVTEAPMEEPVTEAPTEEPVTEAPTEEPVTETESESESEDPTKPSPKKITKTTPKNHSGQTTVKNSSGNPETGDSSNLMLWIGTMMAALAAAFLGMISRRQLRK